MKKNLVKFLFLFAVVIALSVTGFGQSKNRNKKNAPKENVPKIIVPKKEKPPKKNKSKNKKNKPKPQFYSEFNFSRNHFDFA